MVKLKSSETRVRSVSIKTWAAETTSFFSARLFPSFKIARLFAACGAHHAGMSGDCEWVPFQLTTQQFTAVCTSLATQRGMPVKVSAPPLNVNSLVEWEAWKLHKLQGVEYAPCLALLSAIEIAKHNYDSALQRGGHCDALALLESHWREPRDRLFELLESDVIDAPKFQAQATLHFYRTTGPLGCFSNFSRHAFTLDGKSWPTSEHYFQAKKFDDESYSESIRRQTTPALAAKMGRNRRVHLRQDWESVKDHVMLDAVRAKFEQNAVIAQVLLGTHSAILVEHTSADSYWGDGGDGNGKNMLGKILMKVREQLRPK